MFEMLFQPTAHHLAGRRDATRSAILLTILDNVKNRVVELRHDNGRWTRREVDAPAWARSASTAVDDIESDDYFLTVTDFLTPTTPGWRRRQRRCASCLKSMPAWFDAAPYTVSQFAAKSADGTYVPYFVVMRKDASRRQQSDPAVRLRRLRGLAEALLQRR
jgi:prolyl oligopeptidase